MRQRLVSQLAMLVLHLHRPMGTYQLVLTVVRRATQSMNAPSLMLREGISFGLTENQLAMQNRVLPMLL